MNPEMEGNLQKDIQSFTAFLRVFLMRPDLCVRSVVPTRRLWFPGLRGVALIRSQAAIALLHTAVTSIFLGSFIILILEVLGPLHTSLSGQNCYFGGVIWPAVLQT